MIQIRLESILNQRSLSQRALARRSDTHPSVISRLARGDTSRVDLVVLNRICTALEVQPGDLLRFVPEQPELFEPTNGDEATSLPKPGGIK